MSRDDELKKAVTRTKRMISYHGRVLGRPQPSYKDGDEKVTWSYYRLSDREEQQIEDFKKAAELSIKESDLRYIGWFFYFPIFFLLIWIGLDIVLAFIAVLILCFVLIFADIFIDENRQKEVIRAQEKILLNSNLDPLEKSIKAKERENAVSALHIFTLVEKRVSNYKSDIFNKSLNDDRIESLIAGLKLSATASEHYVTVDDRSVQAKIASDYEYFKKRWRTYIQDKSVAVSHTKQVSRTKKPGISSNNSLATGKPSGQALERKPAEFNPTGKLSKPSKRVKQPIDKQFPPSTQGAPPPQSPNDGKKATSVPEKPSQAPPTVPVQDVDIVSGQPRTIIEFNPDSDSNSTNEADYSGQAELGALGETYAMKYERQRIEKAGKKVKHLRQISIEKSGDRYGYDIYSETTDGEIRRIEVKTTKANKVDGFYLTDNELLVLKNYRDTYYIYRLSDYDEYGYSEEPFVVDEIAAERVLGEMKLVPKTYMVKKNRS